MILNNDTSHGAAEQWTSWLGPLAGLPGINFLEVGSWEGASAAWFLRNILTGDGSRITCVDTWHGGGGMPVVEDETVLSKFIMNVGQWLGRVTMKQMRSETALVEMVPESFDVAYIDGSHDGWDVLSDSVLCWRLVKKSGLIIWDDYLYADNNHIVDPHAAIDSFLMCNHGRYRMMGRNSQLCIMKL